MQKIESTLENKIRQSSQIIHSSSTVFWCLVNKERKIDTRISFLNHFLLKRNIPSVSMRLCVRTMSGNLLKELLDEIIEPKVYSYSLLDLVAELGIFRGEFAVYIEFTSSHNLGVPFCAVTSEIVSPTTIDIVHTYGRALESQEIGSKIDFDTSYETGWSVWNAGKRFSNNLIFHNGRLHANVKFTLTLLLKGKQIANLDTLQVSLLPFATYRLNLEQCLRTIINGAELLGIIQGADEGETDVKIKIEGLKSVFPRLLFVSTQTKDTAHQCSVDFIDKINLTHSNFDFDCAEQPASSLPYAFINNPKYPVGVETGFRFYPCKELCHLATATLSKTDSNPIPMAAYSSLRVSSGSPIASRIVGANWSKWSGSALVKECSTGIFIFDYVQHSGFWHWGRLLPRGDCFSATITLVNPFASADESYCFALSIYSDMGLSREESVEFTGSKASVEFTSDVACGKGAWYVLKGDGVGRFNVFATVYFNDLSDGTVEHAF